MYKEAKKILSKIKKSKRILLVSHQSPDADSLCSSQLIHNFLKKTGKYSEIISVDKVNHSWSFLDNDIKTINPDEFDFSLYDLCLILDTANIAHTGIKEERFPAGLYQVCIDHHGSNERYAQINLVDETASSTCEVLYNLFSEWEFYVDKKASTQIFAGIVGDTGRFLYENTSSRVMRITADLLENGADIWEVYNCIYRSLDYKSMRLIFEYGARMNFEDGVLWSFLPYEIYKNYDKTDKNYLLDIIFQSVQGAVLGIRITEKSPDILYVSFRSQDPQKLDVSKLAKDFGGGGHKGAAGSLIKVKSGESRSETVKKILINSKEFLKNEL